MFLLMSSYFSGITEEIHMTQDFGITPIFLPIILKELHCSLLVTPKKVHHRTCLFQKGEYTRINFKKGA